MAQIDNHNYFLNPQNPPESANLFSSQNPVRKPAHFQLIQPPTRKLAEILIMQADPR